MANYKIVNGKLRHCDDELYHWKYQKRYKKNGKWVYVYDDKKFIKSEFKKGLKEGVSASVAKVKKDIDRSTKKASNSVKKATGADKVSDFKKKRSDYLNPSPGETRRDSRPEPIKNKVERNVNKVKRGVSAIKDFNASTRVTKIHSGEKISLEEYLERQENSVSGKIRRTAKNVADKIENISTKTINAVKKESVETINKAEKWINKNLLTKQSTEKYHGVTLTKDWFDRNPGATRDKRIQVPKAENSRFYEGQNTTVTNTKLGNTVNKLKKKKKGNTYRTDRLR